MTAPITIDSRMTIAEYAVHRGCSRRNGYKLRDSGRLVLDADGRVMVMATDALLPQLLHQSKGGAGGSRAASDERKASAAPAPASTPVADPSAPTYTDAAREEKIQRIRKLKLEIAEQAGRLVDRELVERQAFSAARAGLEALLGIADRIATQVAAETDPHRVHVLIDTEARRVAAELSAAAPTIAPATEAEAA